jgi:hypothetical protein
MKLVGRVPVESLDDERWTNIERTVVAGAAVQPERARTSRRYLGFALAAATAMAAGVIGWKLRGANEAVAPEVDTTPIAVHTDPQRSVLEIGDATIASDPATVFTVTRPDGGVLVAMERGKVELEVKKRGNRPPLLVRAGETDVIVVGTHFSVDYGDGHGDVDVRVTEGVVRVVHHAHETRVAAGQEWKTQSGLVALAELAKPAGKDEIDMPPEPQPHKPVTPPTPPTPPTHDTKPHDAGSATPHAPEIKSSGADLRSEIRAEPLEHPLDVGESASDKALARYREIAFGVSSGKFGDTPSHALYSIAYVQSIKQGDTRGALETLDLYRRRFSRHPEYKAALWLGVRILCSQKIDDECRHAAYTYLHDAGGEADNKARLAERATLE